ncbi:TetR family transcriptional regulator [Streptomyces sp. SID5910]|uniref:TetR family transcriptional regulator n=1 Tax=Streptomyces sp. SID5910 TaxID=2690312 RepID=UPI00136BDF1A|nr:TetR family transcriptional regulator [Streptomyces sp. SID5910]MYR45327.1 TetR family transcriptional regulator [Streptomyces sp. SID5910]
MGRWEPNARGRLEQAALELYGEYGFDETTVKQITERAGLTERTFFRHFADKREVLFPHTNPLRDLLVDALTEAPATASAIEAVSLALQAASGLFEERGELARQRQAVIAAHAELRERELVKLAALTSALTEALRQRGVPGSAARLAAEAGTAVFKVAFERWVGDPGRQDFSRLVRETFDELRAVTGGG